MALGRLPSVLEEESRLADELLRPESTGSDRFCLLDVALQRLECSDTAASVKAA